MSVSSLPVEAADHEQLMAQIAYLYYEEMLTQEAIARQLHLTRWKVGRLLRAAREQGIVEISIHHVDSRSAELERTLVSLFPIERAVVTGFGTVPGGSTLPSVARGAARYLASLNPAPHLLGTSWGRTMTAVANAMQDGWAKDVHVVQMNGALTAGVVEGQQNDPAYQISRTGGGRCTMLPVPAIVDIPEVREGLERDSTIAHVLTLAREAPVALFGIGLLGEESVLTQSGYLSSDQVDYLRSRAAVGDVVGRFISVEGELVDADLEARTLGLSLEELRTKDERIAVAHGTAKVDPTLGALRAGVVSTLIVDEDLARSLVEVA
jgi:deoxyribonucleoside regulator